MPGAAACIFFGCTACTRLRIRLRSSCFRSARAPRPAGPRTRRLEISGVIILQTGCGTSCGCG
ncbi:MAG: hypothetical protein IJK02_03370 [Clostridia bacterium]|nr:hypothetical protein [Clostridia bacterium]MBR0508528.1 hypothetical protein [Clostridia bacterium]